MHSRASKHFVLHLHFMALSQTLPTHLVKDYCTALAVYVQRLRSTFDVRHSTFEVREVASRDVWVRFESVELSVCVVWAVDSVAFRICNELDNNSVGAAAASLRRSVAACLYFGL